MPVNVPSTRLAAYVSVRLQPLAYLRVCADEQHARECAEYALSSIRQRTSATVSIPGCLR
jgi:hypothetical protein